MWYVVLEISLIVLNEHIWLIVNFLIALLYFEFSWIQHDFFLNFLHFNFLSKFWGKITCLENPISGRHVVVMSGNGLHEFISWDETIVWAENMVDEDVFVNIFEQIIEILVQELNILLRPKKVLVFFIFFIIYFLLILLFGFVIFLNLDIIHLIFR